MTSPSFALSAIAAPAPSTMFNLCAGRRELSPLEMKEIQKDYDDHIAQTRHNYKTVSGMMLDVLQPAIKLASGGHPVAPELQGCQYKGVGNEVSELVQLYSDRATNLLALESQMMKHLDELQNFNHFLARNGQNDKAENISRILYEAQKTLNWIKSVPADKDLEAQLAALKRGELYKNEERRQKETKDYLRRYYGIEGILKAKGLHHNYEHHDIKNARGNHQVSG